MGRKIKFVEHREKTIEEVFNDFVISQTAEGLAETTLRTYRTHIHSISKHFDIQKPIDELTRQDLDLMIVSMRKAGLAHNVISSYGILYLQGMLDISKFTGTQLLGKYRMPELLLFFKSDKDYKNNN